MESYQSETDRLLLYRTHKGSHDPLVRNNDKITVLHARRSRESRTNKKKKGLYNVYNIFSLRCSFAGRRLIVLHAMQRIGTTGVYIYTRFVTTSKRFSA